MPNGKRVLSTGMSTMRGLRNLAAVGSGAIGATSLVLASARTVLSVAAAVMLLRGVVRAWLAKGAMGEVE